MDTKTLYIEKKKEFNRKEVGALLSNLKVDRHEEVSFLIDGWRIQFIAIGTNANRQALEEICSRLETMGFTTMFSGIIEGTAIPGVVRYGNCLHYQGERDSGLFLETDIIDNRCHLEFPLVTKNAAAGKRIKFRPLELSLPTDLAEVERRINNKFILERSVIEMEREEYAREIVSYLAIATLIYPPSMIWNQADIPRPVERLVSAMKGAGEAAGSLPAYLIMTDSEREFLDLHLHIGFMDRREHIKPMDEVIPPSILIEDQSQWETNLDPADSLASLYDKVYSVRNISELGELADTIKNLSRKILGEGGNARVYLERRDDGVSIRFDRRD